jgi:hypothetical protein
MKDPIVVWIVDDNIDDAHSASVVIQEVGESYRERCGAELTLLCVPDFEWPPFDSLRLIPGTQESGKSIMDERREVPPDIVVLDLVNQNKPGEPVEGKAFYVGLRNWELSRGRSAFVIVWSFYPGGKEAEAFVNRARETDCRLKALATKQSAILQSCFSGFYERVIEERENL